MRVDVSLVIALIAAATSIVSAVIAARSSSGLRMREEQFTRHIESLQFLRDKLTKLYIPMTMYLRITRSLYDRYTEASTTHEERAAIEETARQYNAMMRQLLIDGAIYLEPDAPTEVTNDLLEHLLQIETVYRLKYEFQVYSGPVFAGIKRFGFRRFPKGVDDYFSAKTDELRQRLHRANQTTFS